MNNDLTTTLKDLLDTLNSIQEILFYLALVLGVPAFRLSMNRVQKRQKEVTEAANTRVTELEAQANERVKEQAELLTLYRIEIENLKQEVISLRESNIALVRTVELWRPQIENLPLLQSQYSVMREAFDAEHATRQRVELELVDERARWKKFETESQARECELRKEINTLRETIKKNEAAARLREQKLNEKIQKQEEQLQALAKIQTDQLNDT